MSSDKTAHDKNNPSASNFIRNIVERDLAQGTYSDR